MCSGSRASTSRNSCTVTCVDILRCLQTTTVWSKSSPSVATIQVASSTDTAVVCCLHSWPVEMPVRDRQVKTDIFPLPFTDLLPADPRALINEKCTSWGIPPFLPVEHVPAVRFSGLPADIVGGGYYCSQTGALIPQWLLYVRETVTV